MIRFSQTATKLIQPIIIGYGHSGRSFHAPAIARAAAWLERDHGITVLTPKIVDPLVEGASSVLHRDATIGATHVLHVVTPPHKHLAVVREAIASSYFNFLIEKPAVVGVSQLKALRDLLGARKINALVVANWVVSRLTERLNTLIYEMRGISSFRRIHISQSKPRFKRSLDGGQWITALEVEMPHMLALACDLFGPELTILKARCRPLCGPDHSIVQWMGEAKVHLLSASGVPITLVSDLSAPIRERFIEIEFEQGSKLRGYFPCEASDNHSQIHLQETPDTPWTVTEVIDDDTFGNMIYQAYGYFTACLDKPRNTIDLGLRVSELLAQARNLCGIDEISEYETL